MTYKDAVLLVRRACDDCFYNGAKDIHAEVIENATKIYIKQMELNFEREKLEKENK